MTLTVNDACLTATLIYTLPTGTSSTLSYNLGDPTAVTYSSIAYSSNVSGCAIVLSYLVKDNSNTVVNDGTTITAPYSTYIVVSQSTS
jgi:hypothetical protein